MISEAAQRAIRACAMFSRLEPASIDEIFGCVRESHHRRGTVLFEATDPCQGFYLVVDGIVKVYRAGTDGQETIVHLVGPEETFAEAAMFAEMDYPVSAACTEPCHLLFFEGDRFISLLGTDFGLVRGMFAGMSMWLRRLVDQIDSLGYVDAPRRLARYLIDLPMRREGEQRFVELPARKYLIAGQLGMTPPTFSRCLYRLERNSLIAVEGRRVVILDGVKLERFSEPG